MVSRQAAVRAAVAGFFLVAGTSGAYGANGYDCGVRGLLGAGALYALAIVSGKLIDLVCGPAPGAARARRDQEP